MKYTFIECYLVPVNNNERNRTRTAETRHLYYI